MIITPISLHNVSKFIIASLFVLPVLAYSQAPSPSPSPTKFKLGDPMVDGSFLKPYKNAWKVVYAFPGKEPFLVGTWSDELATVEIDGRHLMKRIQVANYAKYNITSTDIKVFDPKTMAPVYDEYRRADTDENVRRDFDGATVKVTRSKSAPGSKAEVRELQLPEPVFDYYGGMYALLLATFPLKEGFTGTIPAVAEQEDKFEPATFVVRKAEMVEAGPGKQVMAWPVELDQQNREHLIFWISKESPYVIKFVNIIPSGRWVTVTLTMI